MVKESSLVRAAQAQMSAAGAYHINVHGSAFSSSGTPDVVCLFEGTFFGVELKVSGNSPSIVQFEHGLAILRAGGRFVVAYEDFNFRSVAAGLVTKMVVGRNESHFDVFDRFDSGNKTVELVFDDVEGGL